MLCLHCIYLYFFIYFFAQCTSVGHNLTEIILIHIKISPSVTEITKLAGLAGSLNASQDLF